MNNETTPDLYVWTDADGDTVVGEDAPLPWRELDELLMKRYPAAYAQGLIAPSVPDDGDTEVRS